MPRESQSRPGVPGKDWFIAILRTADDPLRVYVLLILVCFLFLVMVPALLDADSQRLALQWGLGILSAVVVSFVVTLFLFSDRLRKRTPSEGQNSSSELSMIGFRPDDDIQTEEAQPNESIPDGRFSSIWPPPDAEAGVYGAGEPPPHLDTWYRELRPTLYQASFYSTPTYYLDTELRIIDFNLAFDLLFHGNSGKLRGKHINKLIKLLTNREDVFRRARDFTNEVNQTSKFPFLHHEPIRYCLLYTSPSPRDREKSRMPSSA